MPNDKIQKLKDLMTLLQNDTVRPQEIEQFLKMVISAVKQTKDEFHTLSKENLQEIRNTLSYISVEHSDILKKIDKKSVYFSTDIQKKIEKLQGMIDEFTANPPKDGKDGYTPVKNVDYFDGKNGIAGKDGSPDTGEQIVDKINELEIEPEKQIHFSHIKDFPKEVGKHIIAHSRNLDFFDETTLVISNPTQIKFQGAGVQISQESTTGALIVTIAGGAGSLIFVDEAMTDSGDHTTFTLSQTPNSGTLLVINENTGQAVPTSAYTNTGTSVTFNSSQQVDDGVGNLVTPTFRARYSY